MGGSNAAMTTTVRAATTSRTTRLPAGVNRMIEARSPPRRNTSMSHGLPLVDEAYGRRGRQSNHAGELSHRGMVEAVTQTRPQRAQSIGKVFVVEHVRG